ncbi:lysosomal alpha-mannosidase-like [Anthonomus grandis grandis]|uniref:lysosomal alpha-mannosidase-like n=1 Tax=Anthonomus grandis grandis TaxID=2921223 RepID=UPI002166927D|nr:lysosomal alpha-mannosidase-like [Anthonomus grandis grandis]
MKEILLILSLFYGLSEERVDPPVPPGYHNCGYQSCHALKEGFINVHIVPHTHDDVGWLKTVDQYYYGSNTNTQRAGVQYILDNVIESLTRNKERRFIYVETAFFWKWWIKQHDIVKSRVRKLVNNGQLEFISGGWSMNDEAVTHYQSIIDQMTWGLRKLNDTFGECGRPKIAWQIDPFGHSREMANIFAELGFDGFFLGRIDYQEKTLRFKTKSPEMVWSGSDSLTNEIFTSILYNNYSPPPGFCFDMLCSDDPFIDDKKSFEYNVDKKVDSFIEYLNNMTNVYNTTNLLITMGEDFNYQDADMWFKNLDKLILYVNQRQKTTGSKFNLIYSTPSCYVHAINSETKGKQTFLVKKDDFFPYASDPHAFWTGYFTSRPTVKRFERSGNNFLQICKQLYALANLGPEDRVDLNALREAMGVMQHHDAITGTEKQHVAFDYARQLQRGIDECEIVTTAAIKKLSNVSVEQDLALNTCPLLNISQCEHTEGNGRFIITVYNPLSSLVNTVVRVPVTGMGYDVTDFKGSTNYESFIIPIPEFVQTIPGRVSAATNDLIFSAEIPALGWKSFLVSPNNNFSQMASSAAASPPSVELDSETGLVKSVKFDDQTYPLKQNFYYYKGFVGNNNEFKNRSSGAYIFRPDGDLIEASPKASYKTYSTPIVAEAHLTFNEYIHLIIRVNIIDNNVEFSYVIGPLPHDGPNGLEVVSKYTTDLQTNGTFYTDSNGRQMLKRVRNYRPAWEIQLEEPESGNYYPVTTQIGIRDEERGLELAVLVDRAQGGTSLNDGEVELMVHRNCLHDDAFGVGEALNETAFGKGLVVKGSHYLIIGKTNGTGQNSMAAMTKALAQKKLLDTWTFITPLKDGESVPNNLKEQFAGLQYNLPENIQILTLEPWIGFSFLLRLQHVFEKDEDPIHSQPVVVPLKDLFGTFEITSARETTLGANQWLEDNDRLQFDTEGRIEDLRYGFNSNMFKNRNYNFVKRQVTVNADSLEVTLQPGQIRTFIVDIQTK